MHTKTMIISNQITILKPNLLENEPRRDGFFLSESLLFLADDSGYEANVFPAFFFVKILLKNYSIPSQSEWYLIGSGWTKLKLGRV